MMNTNCLLKGLCLFLITLLIPFQNANAQISDTLSAQAKVQEATNLAKEGNLTEAIVLFNETATYYKREALWKKYFKIHIDLSSNYIELAQYDEARRSSDTLIHQSKLKLELPELFVISGYHTLGDLNFKLSNLEEASTAYNTALELSLKTYGPDHLASANCYGKIATLNEQIGDDQKSLEYNLKALKIRKKLLDKDHVDIGISYNNIGMIYKNRSQFKKALDYYLKAEKIFEAGYGKSHPKLGIIKNNIGRTYAAQSNNEIAIQYYEEVLEIFTTSLGPDHKNIGFIKTNIAMIYLGDFRYKEAKIYLDEAYEVWSKSLPADHYYNGVYHNNIALIHAMQFDFEAALKSMEAAIHIYKKRLGEESPELAMFYNNVAVFNNTLKKHEQATEAANTAISLNVLQSSNGNLSFKDPCFSPEEQVRAYTIKAEIYFDQFDRTNDLAFAKKAADILVEAENFINLRNKLYISEDDQILSSQTFYAALKQAVSLHSKKYQLSNDSKDMNEAFRYSEKNKSKKLLQSTNVVAPELYARVPTDIIQKERKIRENISNYEAEVLNFAMVNDSINMVDSRDGKLFHEKLRLDTLINIMRTKYPDYFDMKYATDVADIQAIQSAMPEQTLLVSYIVDIKQYEEYQKVRTPKIHIFTISKNTSNLITFPWDIKVDSLIQEYYDLIQKSSIVKTKNRKRFIEIGSLLYEKLIKPIEAELSDKERLVFIGDNMLNYVPFETLLRNKKDQSFKNLDYLIKDFDISYHYSGTLYLKSQQTKQDPNYLNLLAFAPVFDDPSNSKLSPDQQRYFQNGDSDINIDTTTYKFLRDNRFQPLVWSEKEVLAIHELFQENTKQRNKLLLRNDATENALKKNMEKHKGIVHIASHSFPNMLNPKFSGIACSIRPNNEEKEDGILHINEIYNIQIDADLVVLSSCESGFGVLSSVEGMLGINRSFLYSGADNVLYSIWKVNDRTSSQLMVEFYREIFKDKNYAAALRASKLKMMADETTALPNLWAPFVLIGR